MSPLLHRSVALALLLCTGFAHARLRDPTFDRIFIAFDEAGTTLGDDGLAVFALPGARLLAIGTVDVADADPSVVGIGLARLDESGNYDATFAGGGQRVKNAAMTTVEDAAISLLDEILVVGRFGSDSALVRFKPNGADDPTLAGDGGAVFDASGTGLGDVPSAVADVGGGLFVAGAHDVNPGGTYEGDVFLGRVDGTSGAFTALRRADRGSARDTTVDLAELVDAAGNHLIGWLTDNPVPGNAGQLDILHPAVGTQLRTLPLAGLLTPAEGCQQTYTNASSVALVPLTGRFAAIVGNLVANGSAGVQVYVIVVDLVAGTVVSAQCSGTFLPVGTLQVTAAAASPGTAAAPLLHLALGYDNRVGYWRWAATGAPNAPRYAPDPTYAGGMPFVINPQSTISYPRGIDVDARGRPVLVGSIQVGVQDRDFSIDRLHASERIFADKFGS